MLAQASELREISARLKRIAQAMHSDASNLLCQAQALERDALTLEGGEDVAIDLRPPSSAPQLPALDVAMVLCFRSGGETADVAVIERARVIGAACAAAGLETWGAVADAGAWALAHQQGRQYGEMKIAVSRGHNLRRDAMRGVCEQWARMELRWATREK